jgi:hypothetical protein
MTFKTTLKTDSQDLPLPNVYFVSVQNGLDGQTHSLYVAADFTGAAMKKVQNICAERHGFRPYRSNSVVKMRRLRLRDYLENSGALGAAMVTANELGERDTIAGLAKRPQQVRDALAMQNLLHSEQTAPVDAEAAWDALCTAMEGADKVIAKLTA